MTPRTAKDPARLVTAGPHTHPLAGQCPLACLAGLISSHTLAAVTHAMTATWPERDRERQVFADLAAILRDGRLSRARNVGAVMLAELQDVLGQAGLSAGSERPAAARPGSYANWLPADGVLGGHCVLLPGRARQCKDQTWRGPDGREGQRDNAPR
jgi:hypothetical protein